MAEKKAAEALKGERVLFAHACSLIPNPDKPKTEDKIIAVTSDAFVILSAKTPAKVEVREPLFDLKFITRKSRDNTTFIAVASFNSRYFFTDDTCFESLVKCIGTVLRRHFPATPLRQLLPHNLPVDIPTTTPSEEPCDNFLNTYMTFCKFYNVKPDMQAINMSVLVQSRTLRADRLGSLDGPDAPAIISALHFNNWFTSLIIENVKLSSSSLEAIARLVRRTSNLQELTLKNIQADSRFWISFGQSLQANQQQTIIRLDLSDNNIGDSGLAALGAGLSSSLLGTQRLKLHNVGMSAKGAADLASGLLNNNRNPAVLQEMDVGSNQIGTAGVQEFLKLLASTNVVDTLDISNTGCTCDAVLLHLSKLYCQHLSTIDFSNNKFTTKKGRTDPNVGQFFTTAAAISKISLANTSLPSDALQTLLTSLSSNALATRVRLNISGCELGHGDAPKRLCATLPSILSLEELDLSNNDFSDESFHSVIEAVTACRSLQHVNVGQNLQKAKSRRHAIAALETLLHLNAESSLRSLDISDMKLKSDILPVIWSLGRNTSITSVDLSGNSIGDEGARALSLVLQQNQTLRSIRVDDNQLSVLGLELIAAGLERNYSVREFPLPLNDITDCYSKGAKNETAQHVHRIQAVLQRNHSPQPKHADVAGAGQEARMDAAVRRAEQLLETMMGQIEGGSSPQDDAGFRELVGQARMAAQAARSLHSVARDIGTSQRDLIHRRLENLTSGFTDMLADLLSRNTRELIRTLELSSLLDVEDMLGPQEDGFDFQQMCEDVVRQSILQGAAPQILAAASQQLEYTSRRAAELALSQSVHSVRSFLSARSAGAAGVEDLPQAAQPVVLKKKENAAARQMASAPPPVTVDPDDVRSEPSLDLDKGPVQAGAASGHAQLTHVTKARPRPGQRRPPTRRPRDDAKAPGTTSSAAAPPAARSRPSPAKREPKKAMAPPPSKTEVSKDKEPEKSASQAASPEKSSTGEEKSKKKFGRFFGKKKSSSKVLVEAESSSEDAAAGTKPDKEDESESAESHAPASAETDENAAEDRDADKTPADAAEQAEAEPEPTEEEDKEEKREKPMPVTPKKPVGAFALPGAGMADLRAQLKKRASSQLDDSASAPVSEEQAAPAPKPRPGPPARPPPTARRPSVTAVTSDSADAKPAEDAEEAEQQKQSEPEHTDEAEKESNVVEAGSDEKQLEAETEKDTTSETASAEQEEPVDATGNADEEEAGNEASEPATQPIIAQENDKQEGKEQTEPSSSELDINSGKGDEDPKAAAEDSEARVDTSATDTAADKSSDVPDVVEAEEDIDEESMLPVADDESEASELESSLVVPGADEEEQAPSPQVEALPSVVEEPPTNDDDSSKNEQEPTQAEASEAKEEETASSVAAVDEDGSPLGFSAEDFGESKTDESPTRTPLSDADQTAAGASITEDAKEPEPEPEPESGPKPAEAAPASPQRPMPPVRTASMSGKGKPPPAPAPKPKPKPKAPPPKPKPRP